MANQVVCILIYPLSSGALSRNKLYKKTLEVSGKIPNYNLDLYLWYPVQLFPLPSSAECFVKIRIFSYSLFLLNFNRYRGSICPCCTRRSWTNQRLFTITWKLYRCRKSLCSHTRCCISCCRSIIFCNFSLPPIARTSIVTLLANYSIIFSLFLLNQLKRSFFRSGFITPKIDVYIQFNKTDVLFSSCPPKENLHCTLPFTTEVV